MVPVLDVHSIGYKGSNRQARLSAAFDSASGCLTGYVRRRSRRLSLQLLRAMAVVVVGVRSVDGLPIPEAPSAISAARLATCS